MALWVSHVAGLLPGQMTLVLRRAHFVLGGGPDGVLPTVRVSSVRRFFSGPKLLCRGRVGKRAEAWWDPVWVEAIRA